jgi:hypothetical protein
MNVGHLPDRLNTVHGAIIGPNIGVLDKASVLPRPTGNMRVVALPPSGATRGGSSSNTPASRTSSAARQASRNNERTTHRYWVVAISLLEYALAVTPTMSHMYTDPDYYCAVQLGSGSLVARLRLWSYCSGQRCMHAPHPATDCL